MKLLKFLNKEWYYSVVICAIASIICFCGFSIRNKYLLYTAFYFPFLLLSGSLILGILRIFKKKYSKGILQIVFTLVLTAFVFGYFSLAMIFYPYDFFTEGLKIPKDIQFEKPLEIMYDEKKPEVKINRQDLILYDYIQPGIYKYDIFLNKIEKGKIYLKVFEITKNQILSEKGIKMKSVIEVENQTDELKKFELKDHFTVYEGNWGEFYGSRIEVWFEPENKPERKLFTKNYIIQGWMR